MPTAVRTVLDPDVQVHIVQQDGRHWFAYPVGLSASQVRTARKTAGELGFEHREPYSTTLLTVDDVPCVGVELFEKEAV